MVIHLLTRLRNTSIFSCIPGCGSRNSALYRRVWSIIALVILLALYADNIPPGVESHLILSNAACVSESLSVKCVLADRFDSKLNPKHLTDLAVGCIHSSSTLIWCSHITEQSRGLLQCIRAVLFMEKLSCKEFTVSVILV